MMKKSKTIRKADTVFEHKMIPEEADRVLDLVLGTLLNG